MMEYDYLLKHALIIDGSGNEGYLADVAIKDNKIVKINASLSQSAKTIIDCTGLVVAPGFIDVHTHDDLVVIRKPDYIEKTSQGVTTIIVGNCGISAAYATLDNNVPDPINLLGELPEFNYPDLQSYRQKINEITPSVNVATFIGHTTLRNNCVTSLLEPASNTEVECMKIQLNEAMQQGALGLTTGLSYGNAINSSTEEICALSEVLAQYNGLYATHMRTEYDGITDAMQEAFLIGRHGNIPVQISHHKCAGAKNWGRTTETLALIDKYRKKQDINCDCYPYRAGSSNLDLNQITADYDIVISWSTPHPEMSGKTLAEIAAIWSTDLLGAAKQLLPAGAIYFQMHEDDVRRVLQHETSMIGSDGLPCDPNPHPRLWGTFPKVLGYYSREEKLFSLPIAIHKMTGKSALRFSLPYRGFIRENYFADIVIFDAEKIRATATFSQPKQQADGIEYVFVNGVVTYIKKSMTGKHAGQFIARQ